MKPCHTCACFAKRGTTGACLINPVPRRGVTPGCAHYQSRQMKLRGDA